MSLESRLLELAQVIGVDVKSILAAIENKANTLHSHIDATSVSNGFMTIAQVDKLNSVEVGAMANVMMEQGDIIFGGIGGIPTRLAKPLADGQVFFNTAAGTPYYGAPVKGANGISPLMVMGEVATLAAGTSATATLSGTSENPILNLGIPMGTMPTGGVVNFKLISPTEVSTRVSTPASGTLQLDAGAISVYYYTTVPSTSHFTINIRSTDIQTLNDLMLIGETKVVVCVVLNGNNGYRPTGIQIDGVLISQPNIMWAGKASPTVGTANGKDSYSFVIAKVGNNAWEILANQTVYG
jgi:hypothetical protein